MDESKNSQFYDADSGTYEATRFSTRMGRRDHESLMQLVSEQLVKMDLTDVIEVGVGTGRVTREIRKMSKNRLRCVDISPGMLELSMKTAPTPIPEFIEGSAYSLPVPDNDASALISVNLLSHLDDLERFWREAVRVTRPGGQIFVTSTNLLSVFYPFAYVVNRRGRAYGQEVHSTWHKMRAQKAAMEAAGASLVELQGEIYLPRALDRARLVGTFAVPVLRGFRMAPRILRAKASPMLLIRAVVDS